MYLGGGVSLLVGLRADKGLMRWHGIELLPWYIPEWWLVTDCVEYQRTCVAAYQVTIFTTCVAVIFMFIRFL